MPWAGRKMSGMVDLCSSCTRRGTIESFLWKGGNVAESNEGVMGGWHLGLVIGCNELE